MQTSFWKVEDEVIDCIVKRPKKHQDINNFYDLSEVREFYNNYKDYLKTPLVELNNLANELNVANIYVKDESYRFGTNAFKVVGALFAICKLLCGKYDLDIGKITIDDIKNKIDKNITFITATDGNHGKAVAWVSSLLGVKSIIYCPKGTVDARINNIKNVGGTVYVTDFNYDDTVQHANNIAKTNGYILVQDTAYENYLDIPVWIMQGYTQIAFEIDIQMNGRKPTHIFLQAGVGAMATGIISYYQNKYKNVAPTFVIVEPKVAGCIYESAKNENVYHVEGDMDTVMAGLACGVPTLIGIDIIKDFASGFIKCDDQIAILGTRLLYYPKKGDQRIVSGESGSACVGAFYKIMTNDKYVEVRNRLKIDKKSIVLFISTEGNTDPVSFENTIKKLNYE